MGGAKVRAELIEDLGALAKMIPNDESEPKSDWLEWWKAPSSAALITVLVGGLIGASINGCIQQDIQERQIESAVLAQKRELQHDIVTAANTAQLDLHKQVLEDQTEAARQAMDLVGLTVGRTRDLITSRGIRFAYPTGDSPREQKARELLGQQREAIRMAFNEAESQWQASHVGIGLLLEYAYYNDHCVRQAWRHLAEAVQNYLTFATDLKPNAYTPADWKDKFWESQEAPIHESVRNLKAKMQDARQAGLQRSPNVKRIKELLADTDLLQPPGKAAVE